MAPKRSNNKGEIVQNARSQMAHTKSFAQLRSPTVIGILMNK